MHIARQAKGLQPKEKLLLEETLKFAKEIRFEIKTSQMIVPKSTGVRQSRWQVFDNAHFEVFDIFIGKVRRFETADVEFEVIEY